MHFRSEKLLFEKNNYLAHFTVWLGLTGFTWAVVVAKFAELEAKSEIDFFLTRFHSSRL